MSEDIETIVKNETIHELSYKISQKTEMTYEEVESHIIGLLEIEAITTSDLYHWSNRSYPPTVICQDCGLFVWKKDIVTKVKKGEPPICSKCALTMAHASFRCLQCYYAKTYLLDYIGYDLNRVFCEQRNIDINRNDTHIHTKCKKWKQETKEHRLKKLQDKWDKNVI